MRLFRNISALLVLVALSAPSPLTARETLPEETAMTRLSAAYVVGQTFDWAVEFTSRTVVKEGVKVKMDIKVRQQLAMTATVLTVEDGLPTRLRIVVDKHTATVSKASPIKVRAELAGHWFEATVDTKGKQQLTAVATAANFPKGKDALDTISNLIFLPASLPAQEVDSTTRWPAPKGFLGGVYNNLIKGESASDTSLTRRSKDRAGNLHATLTLTAKGEDKSTENGFVAIATGELQRTTEFAVAAGLFSGYQEKTLLVADAQSNDGRSFHSTVTLSASSTTTLRKGTPKASRGNTGKKQ